MTKIKSISVGDWDMVYIKHVSDNFTIIDSFLNDDNKKQIVDELKKEMEWKSITRFISTHPDEDHFKGLKYLNNEINILNFYCVKNETTKKDETEDFIEYCNLRDNTEKSFYIYKGVKRKRMNNGDDKVGSAWIDILWPDVNNEFFIKELEIAKEWGSPNNISPIIKYKLNNWPSFLWMWDLENSLMENIIDDISLPKINILFAPHHWRKSWTIPTKWLEQMNPDIIIMGEAPSENLDYATYDKYNKITQNSAKDITFICKEWKIHIFVSNDKYKVDFLSLDVDYINHFLEWNYIWTLSL